MSLQWSWLGRVPYGQALEDQRNRREAVIQGQQSEVVWLLEHDPVITTGRRFVADLALKQDFMAKGIDLFHTERGGLATYHGPGQVVAYPIVDCWTRGMGAKGAVHAMEQSVIDWLETLDIAAARRPGHPGVWIGLAKICAVGMHFKKGVSMHGIAVNLSRTLPGFELITPCGISNATVTSVEQEAEIRLSSQEAAEALAPHIVRHLLNPTCRIKTRSAPKS